MRDIEDYVNTNFQENARDAVVETIFKSKKLEEVLSTVEGKAIASDIFETITSNVGRIVQITMDGQFDEKSGEVGAAAAEIAILYRHLKHWATLLSNGRNHIEQINKRSIK